MFDTLSGKAVRLWKTWRLDRAEIKDDVLVYNHEGDTIHFEVWKDHGRVELAHFSLSKIPGTLWLYSSGVWVAESYRGRGIGEDLNRFRRALCEDAKAWGLLAFVRGDNTVERLILSRGNWKLLSIMVVPLTHYAQEIWVWKSSFFGVKHAIEE